MQGLANVIVDAEGQLGWFGQCVIGVGDRLDLSLANAVEKIRIQEEF